MTLRMNCTAAGDQHRQVLEPLRLKIPPIKRISRIILPGSVIMHGINHELAGRFVSETSITVELVGAIEGSFDPYPIDGKNTAFTRSEM